MRIKKTDEVMEFIVMCADKPVTRVYISEDKEEVNINRLVPDSIKWPFGDDKLGLEWVYHFSKSRCYEDGKADLKETFA